MWIGSVFVGLDDVIGALVIFALLVMGLGIAAGLGAFDPEVL